ncbi:MAG: vWA domain-containing protein [Pirellulales bacterium]
MASSALPRTKPPLREPWWRRLQAWWLDRNEGGAPVDRDTAGWLASFGVHLGLLLLLAAGTVYTQPVSMLLELESTVVRDDALDATREYDISSDVRPEHGANSAEGALAAAAAAPELAAVTDLPTPVPLTDTGTIQFLDDIARPMSTQLSQTELVRGVAGAGVTGTSGAIDRLTAEILRSLESRETLVVWIFDRSGSLSGQREGIRQRLDRVYAELGAEAAVPSSGPPPLLSAVMAYGQSTQFVLEPTADLAAIKQAVASIESDPTGIEVTFGTVIQAVERYQAYRHKSPKRNVMLVLFSDEVGDDQNQLDAAVSLCQRHEMPVYVVGVPAPFGRDEVYVRYVDPDPKFDQSPQWLPVKQGPESYQPEALRLRFVGEEQDSPPVDSGFGPYGLTRLCYETGGIFFAVHPNRGPLRERGRNDVLASNLEHFFDPQRMQRYQPDYLSLRDYEKLLKGNRARLALVEAARQTWISPMENPRLIFPKADDASLAALLSQAQQAAARLEPQLASVYRVLEQGGPHRDRLTGERWKAGFDLAMGRLLAVKVRTEGYNAMLAQAKQGLKFKDQNSDTWVLRPANTIGSGSALAKQAEQARTYLERVVAEHKDTPWALMAARELETPLGWEWTERHTGVNRPRMVAQAGPAMPQDDQARRAPPPPPRRDPPKL